jgi:hypothetical protein
MIQVQWLEENPPDSDICWSELESTDWIAQGSVVFVLPDDFYPPHGLDARYKAAIDDLLYLDKLPS